MDQIHPFVRLQQRIRAAAKQYRHSSDNSFSIFHPAAGFVYAYDVGEVEAALQEFEKALPSDYQPISVSRMQLLKRPLPVIDEAVER